jgi:hypothetical protein
VQLEAYANAPAANSPEGIHQDGADYVVTALVIARDNVTGGTSRVFVRDLTAPMFAAVLQPGTGLFHADRGTSIFHDVTPVAVIDQDRPGIRSTFGFDINVT